MREATAVEGLLVPPEQLRWIHRLLLDGVARARREAWDVPVEVRKALDIIERGARISATGNAPEGADLLRFRSTDAPPPPDGKVVDVKTAAAELGLTDRRVRQLAASGRIAGHRAGAVWCLSLADVRRFANDRPA